MTRAPRLRNVTSPALRSRVRAAAGFVPWYLTQPRRWEENVSMWLAFWGILTGPAEMALALGAGGFLLPAAAIRRVGPYRRRNQPQTFDRNSIWRKRWWG